MVTADLPPFLSNGDTLDVNISSVGSAKSLSGGVLYQTLLKGADGRVYAAAQGEVSLGGQVGASGSRGAKPHLTAGRIPGGALIECEVPSTLLKDDGTVLLNLANPDFSTAARISEAVNVEFGEGSALAADGGTVQVQVPAKYSNDIVGFIAKLEQLDAEPDQRAKVVINQRTGTLTAGKDVEVQPTTVSHNGMTLTFGRALQGSVASGERNAPPSPPLQGGELLREATTAEEIAAGLSALRLSASDIIAIFEALAASGALTAELELI
jgi:flagellar P-ring protein precursor FlgI